MNKKRVSGQTIAIVILLILLIVVLAFGGVYIYLNNQHTNVFGKVYMIDLKINLESGESGKSEVVIRNDNEIFPGHNLQNSNLVIKNESSKEMFVVVVYCVNAFDKNKQEIEDRMKSSVIDVGYDYCNPSFPQYSDKNLITDWIDYVYEAELQEGSMKYRCLVSTTPYGGVSEGVKTIEVIKENGLHLSENAGDEYQDATISFSFQAYALTSDMIYSQGLNYVAKTKEEKCEIIMDKIYEVFDGNLMTN